MWYLVSGINRAWIHVDAICGVASGARVFQPLRSVGSYKCFLVLSLGTYANCLTLLRLARRASGMNGKGKAEHYYGGP